MVGRTGCRWRSSAGYFELIRAGWSGSAAAQAVGVSLSCGSVWFVDAGRVDAIDKPISSRYLNQDDRIEIADGLARGERVTDIAARIGKSYQTVYREIAATASRTGAINRGMRTTRRTCAANAPGLAAS
nr:helix-turn-helix domain-containing protein [Haloechinothrix alba]